MRIGILTLPLKTNYGGILQAYALQTVLERMGHEVCLIEKKRRSPYAPLWKMPLRYGKRIAKNLIGRPCPIFYEQKRNREMPIERQNTDRFIDRYIKRRIVNDYADIQEHDFDAFVVGSDQIWRPRYFRYEGLINAYLGFTENWKVKRIAYAASFGTEEWEYTPKQTATCARLLKRFDAVSVREASGVKLCEEHFGVKAMHVLDPTMLLTPADYAKLFEAAGTPPSPGTLLNYILDETPGKTALINKVASERGLVPFRVNSRVEDPRALLSDRIQPPVEQWLRGFHDAEFVVTDSFHGCVFSILFNKPFLVVGNRERGMARFDSLLGMFGLEDRMVAGEGDQPLHLTPIDWEDVNARLARGREEAGEFLRRGLQAAECEN